MTALESSQDRIGKVFLELAPYLKFYSTYANDFQSAVKLVEYLGNTTTDGWAQFLHPAPINGTRLNWPKTTIMGHSRGASYPPLVTKLFPAHQNRPWSRRNPSFDGCAEGTHSRGW